MSSQGEPTIESLVAQGYSRVQAIKMIYETNNKPRTGNNATSATAVDAQQSNGAKSPLARQGSRVMMEATRLNRQSFTEPSHMRAVSSAVGEQNDDGDDDDDDEDDDEDEDRMSTPSSLSEDTYFRESSEQHHGVAQTSAGMPRPPLQPYNSSDARQLDLLPMRKLHADLFPSVGSPQVFSTPHHHPCEDEHEHELEHDAYGDHEAELENDIMERARTFLQSSGYSEDERSEFYFLLEQGFGIEEAHAFILQRRDNISKQIVDSGRENVLARQQQQLQERQAIAAEQVFPSRTESGNSSCDGIQPYAVPVSSRSAAHHIARQSPINSMNSAVSSMHGHRESASSAASGSHFSRVPMPQQPLRADALCGDRDRDIDFLLAHGYDIEEAGQICDQVYASRARTPTTTMNTSPPCQPAASSIRGEAHHALMRGDSPSNIPSTNVPKRLIQRIASSASDAPDTTPTIYRVGSSGATVASRPQSMPAPTRSMSISQQQSSISLPQLLQPVLPAGGMQPPTATSPSRPVSHRLSALSIPPYSINTANPPVPPTLSDDQLGLLISHQESKYGVNMFDALLPADEGRIEELVKKGYTLDTAVLYIFEQRYGSVSLAPPSMMEESVSRRSTPTAAATKSRSFSIGEYSVSASAKPIDLEAANQVEAEIALLMASGYVREEAVQILLRRKTSVKDEDSFSVSASDNGRMNPLNRAASTPKQASGVGGGGGGGSSDLLKASFANHAAAATAAFVPPSSSMRSVSSRDYHSPYEESPPALRGRTSSRDVFADPLPPANRLPSRDYYPTNTYEEPPPTFNPPSSYAQYGSYSQSLYMDERMSFGAASSGGAGGCGGGYEPEPYIDRSQLPLSKLSSDERALRVGLMISEQETMYGTNMFESMNPMDQSALDQLRMEGYEEDEAAQFLFESKVRSGMIQARPPPPAPKPRKPVQHEHPDIAEAIRISEREQASRPGVVRVAGPGAMNISPLTSNNSNYVSGPTSPNGAGLSPHGGGFSPHGAVGGGSAGYSPHGPTGGYSLDLGDTRDLDPQAMSTLTGMGFTPAQSAQALRMHRYDLHDAANYLLGNQ